MRYKNEDDNRYRVNFMIATEKLMDKLTVREFISYLEEKAEFEDTTHEYIEESEPAPEQRARNLIGSLATSQLLDQWEMTTTMTDPNTSTLRGWFMDELEKRFPDQFDKWLDSECRDEELRSFIYA